MKYYYVLFIFFLISLEIVQNAPNNLKRNSKCSKGEFSYNNNCLLSCPTGVEADNYTMQCKNPSESPVFIKAYTTSRCMNRCGDATGCSPPGSAG